MAFHPYKSRYREMDNWYWMCIKSCSKRVSKDVVLGDDLQLLQSLGLFIDIVIVPLYSCMHSTGSVSIMAHWLLTEILVSNAFLFIRHIPILLLIVVSCAPCVRNVYDKNGEW